MKRHTVYVNTTGSVPLGMCFMHTSTLIIPLTHSHTHVYRVYLFIHSSEHSVLCLLLEELGGFRNGWGGNEWCWSLRRLLRWLLCYWWEQTNKILYQYQILLPNVQEQNWTIKKSKRNTLLFMFILKNWKCSIISKHALAGAAIATTTNNTGHKRDFIHSFI